MDYDGYGKTYISHINESGVNIYTFDILGSTCTVRKVAAYKDLKNELVNRYIAGIIYWGHLDRFLGVIYRFVNY